ncbi:MAG: RES family NAD+ phosphorylase [Thermoanaerobaculia bacterium]|nr:RES family NAD+ phosphorylase [Thermoanaerobaculia bacterium]
MVSSSERRAWRLVKTKFLDSAFKGEGARRYGGRWNSPGVAVVYLAGSPALAVLEVLVHLDDTAPLGAYSLVPVEFPANFVHVLPAAQLPVSWAQQPAPLATRELGDEWASSERSVLLAVPSVVVPEEEVLILNPRHPDAPQVRVGTPRPFQWDRRLLVV